MITYVINELELDNESAQFVRRDPVSCKVNYDTYKLLNFKWYFHDFYFRLIKTH